MDYFKEKSHQLNTGKIIAFGIPLLSRYSNCAEMIQMLTFAELLARNKLNGFVSDIFYDSKAYICSITPSSSDAFKYENGELIFNFAKKTIDQFLWNDQVFHKENFGLSE